LLYKISKIHTVFFVEHKDVDTRYNDMKISINVFRLGKKKLWQHCTILSFFRSFLVLLNGNTRSSASIADFVKETLNPQETLHRITLAISK